MNTIANFQAYLIAQDLSPLTIRGYLADLKLFSKWFEQTNAESFTPEHITPTDIREYKRYLLTVERRKANTVNRRLSAISTFVKWAQTDGQIGSNPAENIKLVQAETAVPKWLDKNEQYALQRAIERDLQISKLRYPKRWVTRRRDASMALFLLNTGLRLSELSAMRMEDFQLSDRKGSLIVQNGKGGKQREVPLNTEARKALQEWIAVRPQDGTNLVWIPVESGSDNLSNRAIQRVFRRYAQDARLEDFSPHIARHTFAKNLVNKGVGLEKVAALLGHTSLNTTRLYVAPDKHDLELAVEQLN